MNESGSFVTCRTALHKERRMIMIVNTMKSFLSASSYKTIPTQENRGQSGEKQPDSANEKTLSMKKKESAIWKDTLSMSLHSTTKTVAHSAGASSYSRVRHVVYKQNLLDRQENSQKNSQKAVLKESTKDEKQKEQMKKAVSKYVVSETFVRLPASGHMTTEAMTAIFGNYPVDKTYQMKLCTIDVQC